MTRIMISALLLGLSLSALSPSVQAESYDDMIQAVKNDFGSDTEDLLQRGFDVNGSDPDGNSLVMLAASNESPKAFAALMRFHPDLTKRNRYGETVLMLAAYKRQKGMVDALIKAGAPINQEGWTPLHYAASAGDPDIVTQLLAAGAKVNVLAPDGSSPLIMAAREGHSEALIRLLGAGANPNIENRMGMTALQWANRRQDTDNADLLRRAGARK